MPDRKLTFLALDSSGCAAVLVVLILISYSPCLKTFNGRSFDAYLVSVLFYNLLLLVIS